ncbi:FxsA family protein [Halothiobacillus sp.]|uniref:FxsA family protein n=1 Tax=Halothiobacillus sp. TaxID=1891311 RepID=UPI002611E137|nr:FxsA family protein [Halothiobacillus sp.]
MMNPLSLIALLPVIEIVLLIGMGALFGFWFTLAWIIATAAVGVYLLRRMRGAFQIGSPLDPVAESLPQDPMGTFATWIGAILLILPGPLTDLLGLVLVMPWLRKLTFGVWMARNLHKIVMKRKGHGQIYEGEIVDVQQERRVIRRGDGDHDK